MSNPTTPTAPLSGAPASADRWTVDPAPPAAAVARATRAYNEYELGPIDDAYAPLAVTGADHLGEIFPSLSVLLSGELDPVPSDLAERLGSYRPLSEMEDGGIGAFKGLCRFEPQLRVAYVTASRIGIGVESVMHLVLASDDEASLAEIVSDRQREAARMLAAWVGALVGPSSRWRRHPVLGLDNAHTLALDVVMEAYLLARAQF